MSFLEEIRTRATAARRRIVFPESSDARTVDAVKVLVRGRIVDPGLVLDPARPETHSSVRALSSEGIEVLDPATDVRTERVATELLELRSSKGLTEERADELSRTPLYFADGLVRSGEVDGCVAGAVGGFAAGLNLLMPDQVRGNDPLVLAVVDPIVGRPARLVH